MRPEGDRGAVLRHGYAAALLAICLVTAGCSGTEPSRSANAKALDTAVASSTQPSGLATPPPSPSAALLEGRWTAGPVPIGDIKRVMMDSYGVSAEAADGWIGEIGSPTSLAFSLEFTGSRFIQRWQVPGRPMEVGEDGTFVETDLESGNEVLLSVRDGDGVDTYTLHVILDHDRLSLRWVASTEHGTAADQAIHRLFTIGFYCSTEFARAP